MKKLCGGRRHILEWSEQARYLDELLSLLSPMPLRLLPTDPRLPKNSDEPSESRLEAFGPIAVPAGM